MSCGAITINLSGQPQNVSQNVGTDAIFTVTAVPQTGITYTYQWYEGLGVGIAIPGEVGASYTKFSIQAADSATTYSCVVTANPGGCTAQTNHAVLFVTGIGGIAPSITTQPISSQTVSPGDSVNISVISTGDAPIFYQWFYENIDLEINMNSISLSMVGPGQAGLYRVMVYNAAGFVYSNFSQLLVVGGPGGVPTITTQPISVTALPGATAVFSVIISSISPVTYQWFRNSVAISGANVASYSTTVGPNTTGTYMVQATNTASSVSSNSAVLLIGSPGGIAPVFTTQPTNLTVSARASAVFTSIVSDQVATFQWYFAGTPLSGATNSILTIPRAEKANAGSYYVRASNVNGTTQSNTVTLTVSSNLTWLWILLGVLAAVIVIIVIIVILVLVNRPPKKVAPPTKPVITTGPNGTYPPRAVAPIHKLPPRVGTIY